MADFPIGLMAYNVLSASIDRGYLAVFMLRTESYQDHTTTFECMQRLLDGRAVSVTDELGWLAEFCGHSFPSRAILLINSPLLDHIGSLVSVCH